MNGRRRSGRASLDVQTRRLRVEYRPAAGEETDPATEQAIAELDAIPGALECAHEGSAQARLGEVSSSGSWLRALGIRLATSETRSSLGGGDFR